MRLKLLSLAAPLLLSSCVQHKQLGAVKAPALPSALQPAMQRQVQNAVDAGDGDAELRMLRARLIDSPSSLSARLELGKAYEQRGYPELALDHYRWAAEHFPQSADAHLMLARSLNHTEHSVEAIGVLQIFLKAHPQNGPALYSWLGIMQDDAGDWKSSEQAYREAIEKAAEDKDYLHNNLGFSLLQQGQHERAAEQFRAALKLNPRSEIARDNLGIALAANPAADQAANLKEAVLHWQSLNEPATAHSNLAAVLMEQGKFVEARKELWIALQYNQANPAAIKNLELLSTLDGKPVTMPSVESTKRWSRFRSSWRRWFAGGGDGQDGDALPAVQEKAQTAGHTELKQ